MVYALTLGLLHCIHATLSVGQMNLLLPIIFICCRLSLVIYVGLFQYLSCHLILHSQSILKLLNWLALLWRHLHFRILKSRPNSPVVGVYQRLLDLMIYSWFVYFAYSVSQHAYLQQRIKKGAVYP